MKERAKYLEAAFNCVADGVLIADGEMRIVEANLAAEAITGYRREELLGRKRTEIFRGKVCGLACVISNSLGPGHTAGNDEVKLIRKDGQGRFELAQGGTLFLDEIGDVTPAVQMKLLRAIEQKEIERVGESRSRQTDVRVIAATNRDLEALKDQGRFREDLYYRLKVVPVHLPPLRERRGDIPLLVHHFIEKFNQKMGRAIEGISLEALSLLLEYPWPGNVRELENAIEYAFIQAKNKSISLRDFPWEVRQPQGREETRAQEERRARSAAPSFNPDGLEDFGKLPHHGYSPEHSLAKDQAIRHQAEVALKISPATHVATPRCIATPLLRGFFSAILKFLWIYQHLALACHLARAVLNSLYGHPKRTVFQILERRSSYGEECYYAGCSSDSGAR